MCVACTRVPSWKVHAVCVLNVWVLRPEPGAVVRPQYVREGVGLGAQVDRVGVQMFGAS